MTRAAVPRSSQAAFLKNLDSWRRAAPPHPLSALIAEHGGPQHVGVIVVDMIEGFCRQGPLASPRVGAIITPIADLLTRLDQMGVTHCCVLCDSHQPDATEFAAFPPHCIAKSAESRIVPELADLPLVRHGMVATKNALSAWVDPASGFVEWVDETRHNGVTCFIVVGDCTDLCVYHTAMPLKMTAFARNELLDVVVPINCVETYDVPLSAATDSAMLHDGDVLQAVFLYHMRLNGIRVVGALI